MENSENKSGLSDISTSDEEKLLSSPPKTNEKKFFECAAMKIANSLRVKSTDGLIRAPVLTSTLNSSAGAQLRMNSTTNKNTSQTQGATINDYIAAALGETPLVDEKSSASASNSAANVATSDKTKIQHKKSVTSKTSTVTSGAFEQSQLSGSAAKKPAHQHKTNQNKTEQVQNKSASKHPKVTQKAHRPKCQQIECRMKRLTPFRNIKRLVELVQKHREKMEKHAASVQHRLLSSAKHIESPQNLSSTSKRSRIKGETPPDMIRTSKVSKNSSQTEASAPRTMSAMMSQTPQTSMADTVKDANLLVAVIDMPVPGIVNPMSKERYRQVYEAINMALAASVKLQIQLPRFDENSFVRGVMRVRCATPGARTWLASAMPYIPCMWSGMKLCVVDFDAIPAPFNLLGLFPNCSMDSNTICNLLQGANEWVNVSRWSILNQKQSSIGMHICFAVSEDQYEIVENNDFRLYFGSGVAKFKDLSENTRDAGAQNEVVEEQHPDASDQDENQVTMVNTAQTTLTNETAQSTQTSAMEVDTNTDEGLAQQSNASAVQNPSQTIAQQTGNASAALTAGKMNAPELSDDAMEPAEQN